MCVSYAEDDISIRSEVDRPIASIGDNIKYTITVAASKNVDVRLPAPDETMGNMRLKDSGSDIKYFMGKKTVTGWCILSALSQGEYTIPPLDVQYKNNSSQEWLKGKTKEVKVEIKSVLAEFPEARDIRDIKGPMDIPSGTVFYIIAGIAFAVLLLAFFLRIFLKNRKDRKPFAPPKLPHEIAYERLEELKNKNLISAGKVKEFYVELSDIARRYLEARFFLRAPEMTTEEFLARMKSAVELKAEHKGLLKEFLSHCDLVKFAKYGPSEKELESSFGSAVKFVDETKETEEKKEEQVRP